MAVGIPGVGMVRFLSIGIGLNDQFSQGAAKLNAQVNAMTTAMAGMDRQLNLIRSKMFLTGFATATVVGGIVKQGAEMERQLTLASFAAGGVAESYRDLNKLARSLSIDFGISPDEVAEMLKDISQAGVPKQFVDDLGRAGAMLQQITGGEIDDSFVAESIFKIGKATTKTQEEFDAFLEKSEQYASAMKIVGDLSVAGAPEVARMAAAMQPLGTIANVSAAEMLALAGGLADVDAGAKQAFSTALSRIFSDKFLDPNTVAEVAKMMGKTSEEIVQMRRNKPFELIMGFAEALGSLGAEAPSIEILEGLKFTERDKKTFAALTQSGGKIAQMLAATNAELGKTDDNLVGMQQMADLSGTLSFSWAQLAASVKNFADTVTQILAPVLGPLLKLMTGFVQIIASNKLISGTITIAALAAVIGSMVNGMRAMAAIKSQMTGDARLAMDAVSAFGFRGGAKTAAGAGKKMGFGLLDRMLLLGGMLPGRFGGRFFKGKTAEGLVGGAKGRFAAGRTAAIMQGMAPADALFHAKQTTKSGRMFGGLLGLFGGKKGAGAAASLAGKQIGGRALINVIPVVGQILSLLSLLERPFGMAADFLREASEKAGPMGIVFKSISAILRVFQFLGAVINGAINTIINAVKALFDLIGKIPGVKEGFNAIGKGIDAVGDFLGGASDKVSKGFTFNQTNNFSTEAAGDGGLRASQEEQANRIGALSAPRAATAGAI